jgi:ribosomal protein S13
MFKFKDTDLPFDYRLRDSLTSIYGIGFQRSSYICDSLGLGLSFNINLLNSYFYDMIVTMLKSYYILEDRLKNILNQRLNFFLENRRIVGIRLFKGLPVRGQRTQTNCANARNLKPISLNSTRVNLKEVKAQKKNKKLGR